MYIGFFSPFLRLKKVAGTAGGAASGIDPKDKIREFQGYQRDVRQGMALYRKRTSTVRSGSSPARRAPRRRPSIESRTRGVAALALDRVSVTVHVE
jgi:hypothetical protein